MVAKEIFLFVTMTGACKKVNFMDFFLSTIFVKLPKKNSQTVIFMGKSHELSLFATIGHCWKGKNILRNHDSWFWRIFSTLQPWLTVAKKLISWDFPIIFMQMIWLLKTCMDLWTWQKKSLFYFLFFQVDSNNPKINLESLVGFSYHLIL